MGKARNVAATEEPAKARPAVVAGVAATLGGDAALAPWNAVRYCYREPSDPCKYVEERL
jgi:hypothetical protein